jgi:ABC-2 type transport system permease protein
MIRSAPVVAITLRGLLDRRRFWLMVLLAAAPVLLTLFAVALGDEVVDERVFDQLVVRSILPLLALVFGTGAMGTELEDGTVVYLLAKPGHRFRLVLAKGVVASAVTAALAVSATLLTGLVAATQEPDILAATLAYAVAVAVGASAYTLGFMTLSTITTRALAVGLGYVLLWEGILAGLLPGTQTFSVRQATLGLADMLGATEVEDPLDPGTSVVVLGIVIVGSLLLSGWRMSRYQLRGGD